MQQHSAKVLSPKILSANVLSPKILSAKRSLEFNLQGIKLIEASAGTGKTYTISNLFCRFIIEGKALQNILLVSFTNAASDELKQRIRLRLKNVLALFKSAQDGGGADEFLTLLLSDFQAKDKTEQTTIINRLSLAMRSFDEASIHTINGFCQRMLGDYAFNSAQHYELNLLQNDTELWQMGIKDWWRSHSYTLHKSHYDVFIKAVKSIQSLDKNSALLRSDNKQILIPSQHKSLHSLYAEWDELENDIKSFKADWPLNKQAVFDIFGGVKIFKKQGLHHANKIDANLAALNTFLTHEESTFLIDEFQLLSLMVIKKNTLKSQYDALDVFNIKIFQQADYLWKTQQQLSQQFRASALIDAERFASKQTSQAKLKQQSLTFNDQLKHLDTALMQSDGALAKSIRCQFPIALIDEFQDTNDIQYSIFKHIYQGQKDISLIMIGDPKQAIYSFRGGDIFTYMQAKKQVGDELFSLNSNWRSSPALIDAVNCIFNLRDDTFIYPDAMPFNPVKAGSATTASLSRSSEAQAALSLWHLASEHNTQSAAININHHVANEISALINEGQNGLALLGEQAVKPADIAVLVRSNYEGKELAIALQQRGIHAINIGKDKVLQSDSAKGLLLLMMGIAQVDDIQASRNMLASRLMMFSPLQINHIINTQSSWLAWLKNVNKLYEIWLQDGFVSMFYTMLSALNIAQSIIQQAGSERQITNLLHSVEIIQSAAKTHATPQALCAWLKQQIDSQQNNSSDEDELRLESDAQLVKIVTVHKSKGLEYPIVFVPFLWKSKALSKSQFLYQYHNQQQQKVVDFVLPDDALNTQQKQAFINADKERLAEDMRLLYVALTRAKSKCYLITGQVSRSGSAYSALAFLCHPAQSADDLQSKRAELTKAYTAKHDLAAQLNLIAQSSSNIDFKILDKAPKIIKSKLATPQQTLLEAADFSGHVNFDWHISSFSRMTRDVHQVAHSGQMQATDDEIFNFKRGGNVGTFLHHILELSDFSGDIKAQSTLLFQRFAPRYHLESENNERVVARWMEEIVHTELNPSGFKLSHLKPSQRLDELEFDFSLAHVDIKALNQFLEKRSGQSTSMLNINNFKGLITGFIDLVFEHQGQYYVADYKSNFLGTQQNDYSPDKLKRAIIDRRYDLQYLLYSLALHRYLKYRLPNYDYERHCGGVYYLFLRAMRRQTGQQFGVFYDRPSLQEMHQLDNVLFKAAGYKQ